MIPGKGAGKTANQALQAKAGHGAVKDAAEGNWLGAVDNTLDAFVPGYGAVKSAAKTLTGQGFSSRGIGSGEGTPQKTAFDIRHQARLLGEPIYSVSDTMKKSLIANPEVADKAYQKGFITRDVYQRVSRGREHVGSWRQPVKKTTPPVSENQIKNQEEPIIEEVMNYLLSKMEIL